jgi:hypothetical protein
MDQGKGFGHTPQTTRRGEEEEDEKRKKGRN